MPLKGYARALVKIVQLHCGQKLGQVDFHSTNDISQAFLTARTAECQDVLLREYISLAEVIGEKEDLCYCKKSRTCWPTGRIRRNMKNIIMQESDPIFKRKERKEEEMKF